MDLEMNKLEYGVCMCDVEENFRIFFFLWF